MTIKLVIFDLDGVLFDGADLHYIALNESLSEVDKKFVITHDQHVSTFNGLPTKKKLEMLTSTRGLDASLHESINKDKQTRFLAKITNLKKNERITCMLLDLKRLGYKMAVASNSIRMTVEKVLGSMEILGLFDAYLSNEDVKNSKPSPDIYTKCIEMFGVKPEETVIVEDSFVGKCAAIASGAHVVPVLDPTDVTTDKLTGFIRFAETHSGEINVVIPMAGLGTRFSNAGYEDPKPFIDVKGKPMIQWVVENINIVANYIFIVQKEHMKKYGKAKEILEKITVGRCRIIEIDGVTDGAARTILKAEEFINNDSPLVTANSDQFISWNVYDFLNGVGDADGSILCFKELDGNPKWSFAKVNEDDIVTEVAEKKVISDLATVGVYYFKKGRDFVKHAYEMIDANIRTNNEFYLCPVYNEYVRTGEKITVGMCDKMWGLGTPEDLVYFVKNFKF